MNDEFVKMITEFEELSSISHVHDGNTEQKVLWALQLASVAGLLSVSMRTLAEVGVLSNQMQQALVESASDPERKTRVESQSRQLASLVARKLELTRELKGAE